MKSVDKNKGLPSTIGQQLHPINKIEIPIKFSNYQPIVDCLEETISCINNIFSYQEERERTKQIEMECLTRVRESENRLKEVEIQEITKQLTIVFNHIKEIGELQSEREIIDLFRSCVEQIISVMNDLKSKYEKCQDFRFIEMLNEQTSKLIDLAKTIASLS